MAERKKLDLGPKLDNSAPAEPEKRFKALDEQSLVSAVRMALDSSSDGVKSLHAAVRKKMEELGVPSIQIPISRPEGGSGQVDVGSLVVWIQGVDGTDQESVYQLQVLDSVCRLRG